MQVVKRTRDRKCERALYPLRKITVTKLEVFACRELRPFARKYSAVPVTRRCFAFWSLTKCLVCYRSVPIGLGSQLLGSNRANQGSVEMMVV